MMKKPLAIVLTIAASALALAADQDSVREALWPVLVKYSTTISNKDLTGHMSCYAEKVNWFGKTITREQLQTELAKQFKQYDTMSMSLMEEFDFSMKATTASVTCRKMWYFCEKAKGTGFCGTTQAKFGLVREAGQWKINSVSDLAVLWVEKKSSDCCLE